MSGMKIFNHCIFLVFYNWIIFITIRSDTMYFKGVIAIGGLGKDVGIFGMLIIFLFIYIHQFYIKEYKLFLKEKTIIGIYLASPLFIIWFLMNLYLFSISRLLQRVNNIDYLILIYLLLCFLLVYFQYRILMKFEKIKNKKINDISDTKLKK